MASSSSMDWDRFFRENDEMGRRMRDLASQLQRENAESRRQRAEAAAEAERLKSERLDSPPGGATPRPLFVRERPPDEGALSLDERFREFQSEMRQFQSETRGAFAEVRQELLAIRRDVAESRDQIRVELESMGDKVQLVAEGFASTNTKLQEVANLIRRYTTTP
jgi:hypothetical protein